MTARRIVRVRAGAPRSSTTVCLSWDEMVDRFMTYQQARSFSSATLRRRRASLRSLQRFVDGGSLDRVTPEQIEAWLVTFDTPQTRHSYLSDVSMLFRFLNRRGFLTVDPTSRLDSPRVPERAASPLRPADLYRAIDTAAGELRLMIVLGAYAGLRVSEIGALDAADFRLEERLIVVRRGKGGKGAVLPMAPEIAELVAGLPPGPVFGCTGHAVSQRIRYHFRRLGIDARAHDLRHTYATTLAQRSNGNLVLVQKLMRHSNVATTQRYVGWSPDAAELLAGGLHGQIGGE